MQVGPTGIYRELSPSIVLIPTCLSDSTPAVSALLRKNLILSGCWSFSLSVDIDNTYSINIPMDYEYIAYVVKSNTILSYICLTVAVQFQKR